MRSRVQRILLVAVMVLGLLPVHPAMAERSIDGEFPLAVAPGGQVQPDMDWPYVVYKDGRYDALEINDEEAHVRVYNMLTGEDFPVSPENVGLWKQSNPSISGTRVVYSDQRNDDDTGCDIWMYDIATGEETQLTNAPAGQGNPFIHGDIVAWVDRRSGTGTDIWMMDLASGEETAVAPNVDGSQYEPVVWEDYIVWRDYRHSWDSVFLYDLASGEETCVAEGWYADAFPWEGEYFSDPFVYDDAVVYRRWASFYDTDAAAYYYEQSIEMYDIATGETRTISTETAQTRRHPVMRDGWVTWHDRRSGDMEVWGYNLETEEEVLLVAAEPEDEDTGWFKYAGRSTTAAGWVLWHDHRPWDGDDEKADLYAKWIGEGRAPTMPMALAGADRYKTAIEVSQRSFPEGADTIVVATGMNWPDALAGSALAGVAGAPVLLIDQVSPMTTTSGYGLVADITAEIERLGATDAYILGGEQAVSAKVEAALVGQFGMDVTRLGGADRFETSCLIADEVAELSDEWFEGVAFVATGMNFPDALAAAPLAAFAGYPVFLSGPSGVPTTVLSCMEDLGIEDAFVLGGTAVVPQKAVDQLTAIDITVIERLAGADRYGTAAAVAEYGFDEFGMAMDTVGIATGVNYPDALAVGAALGQEGYLMALTGSTALPKATEDLLTEHADEISRIRFVGGPVAIAESVRAKILALLH